MTYSDGFATKAGAERQPQARRFATVCTVESVGLGCGSVMSCVTDASRMDYVFRDFGAEILSGLNLWNRNTEQVADTLSRDNGLDRHPGQIAAGDARTSFVPISHIMSSKLLRFHLMNQAYLPLPTSSKAAQHSPRMEVTMRR